MLLLELMVDTQVASFENRLLSIVLLDVKLTKKVATISFGADPGGSYSVGVR